MRVRADGVKEGREGAKEDEMNAMFNTEPFAAAIGSGSEEGPLQEREERQAKRPFSLYGIFKGDGRKR